MQILRKTVDRILEPRALWGVARIAAGSQASDQGVAQPAGLITLPRQNWHNGSRHTQVLTHICLAPINYILQRNNDAGAKIGANFNNSGSILNRMRLRVTVPGLYTLSTEDLAPVGFAPQPTQPSMEFSATTTASSLFGIHRWDFDFEAPFWLPRRARIQFDLSAWGAPASGGYTPDVGEVSLAVLFNELPMEGFAERLPGTARLRQREEMLPAATATVSPAGPTPFQPDAFGGSVVAGPAANGLWPNAFLPNVWDRQESTRGATHSAYSGFGVLIDQLAYDAGIASLGPYAGMPITMLANRVAVRARTTNGGSNEWWWRPGAPLSLVTPTIGSALTFKLERPVVLAPGDALIVQVQAPELDLDVTQTYQLGVSMLGYARIEA